MKEWNLDIDIFRFYRFTCRFHFFHVSEKNLVFDEIIVSERKSDSACIGRGRISEKKVRVSTENFLNR